jgi:hypothetical protein
MISDGCGNMLNCGASCPANQTCGGGGTPNVCGCTPSSCAAQGKNCGTISDGCGGTPSCGSCLLPQTCGGGGTPNVCGCMPTSCAAQGKNCGTISDGCGLTLTCGTCQSPNTCGGGGIANVCGCTADLEPDPTGTTAGLVHIFNSTTIRSYTYTGQSFTFPKQSIALSSFQLRGAYNVGLGKGIISLGIYPDAKGQPDGSNPLWKGDFALAETTFRENDSTKPTVATPHTFKLPDSIKIVAGATYYLLVSTNVDGVNLYAYDAGATGLGDAIKYGQAYTYTYAVPTWTPIKTADLHVVLNPCN